MGTQRRIGVSERRPAATHEGSGQALHPPNDGPDRSISRAEVLVAVVTFAALCVAVLTRAVQLLDPDDYANRASIIALTRGHLSLTSTQYQDLLTELSSGGGQGIAQWVQSSGGTAGVAPGPWSCSAARARLSSLRGGPRCPPSPTPR